jgi:soluble lytic murein transglycosylase
MAGVLPISDGRGRIIARTLYAVLAAAGTAILVFRIVRENRFHRYDALIAEIAAEHGVEGRLLWRMVRRESRFNPAAVGAAGEVGLMQVTDAAARDWAAAQGIPPPGRAELFDPRANLRVGAWYLSRALRHWGERDRPEVYALAEYNAGRSNAARWSGSATDAEAFLSAITYPSTRRYIRDVLGLDE